MSCNCNDIKRFQNIDHVRNLAQKLANYETQNYCLYKCWLSTSKFYYNFAPASSFLGKTVEILQPLQRDPSIEIKASNRRKQPKSAGKKSKVRKETSTTEL